jgi:hypothetical protein
MKRLALIVGISLVELAPIGTSPAAAVAPLRVIDSSRWRY